MHANYDADGEDLHILFVCLFVCLFKVGITTDTMVYLKRPYTKEIKEKKKEKKKHEKKKIIHAK